MLVLPREGNADASDASETHRIIVADYSPGLLQVDVARRPARSIVSRVTDAPGTTSRGIDGIVWHDGSVIAVQHGIEPSRLAQFTLDASRSRVRKATVLDRQPELADEPTIVTRWRDGVVYVGNSQWEKYNAVGARTVGTVLSPTRLIFVPLRAKAAPDQ